MEIWVVGDTRFMYEVFNAVAMITASNDWLALIRVGFMLGMLLIAFSALMNQKLELHHMLISFIIYGCMFVPKSTAILVDAFNPANIRAVDNVPVGVVFTASLLSKIGKGMTDLNEQAFQPIDPSQTSYEGLMAQGYLDPLKDLLKMRETMYSSTASDLDYNLKDYYANCTARNLQNKTLTAQQIMNAPNVWQAARAPSPILTTTWSTGGSISERTCFDADADLDVQLTRATHENILTKAVASVIGEKDPTQVLTKLQGPFQSIAGAGVQAYDYMFNVIQMQYLVSGADMATARSGDMTYAYIVQSARERRDLNHAVEKTLFEDIMRPIMTFFEALIYSVSPLMVFLFVMGPLAVKFVSKYILLAAWVQLWLPMFAIIKLFTYLALNGDMDSMQSNGLVPGSLEWAWAFQQNLSRWIGISGWLSAATPTISLALVYGGAVTANSIASRMQSVSRESAAQAANTFSPGLLTTGPSGVTMGDTTYQPQATNAGYAFARGIAGTQNSASSPFSMQASENEQVRDARSRAEGNLVSMASQYSMSLAHNDGTRHDIQSRINKGAATNFQESNRFDASVQAINTAGSQSGVSLSEDQRNSVLMSMGLSGPFGLAAAKNQIDSIMGAKSGLSVEQRTAATKSYQDALTAAYNRTESFERGHSDSYLYSNATQRAEQAQDQQVLQNQAQYNEAREAAQTISHGSNQVFELQGSQMQTYVDHLRSNGDFRFSDAQQLGGYLSHLGRTDLKGLQSFAQEASRFAPVWGDLARSAGRMAETVARADDLKAHIPDSKQEAERVLLGSVAPPSEMAAPKSFYNRENKAMTQGEKDADKFANITSEDKIVGGYNGARPGIVAATERKYQETVTPILNDAEAAVSTSDTAQAGENARGAHKFLNGLFPDKQDRIDDTVASFRDQWSGLAVQMSAKAQAASGASVASTDIRTSDTKQQMELGRDPSSVEALVGKSDSKQIQDNAKTINALGNAYMRGDEGAGDKLKQEFTRISGSESSGAALFEQYKQGASEVQGEQRRAAVAFGAFEAAPAAGILNPVENQSPEARDALREATASRNDNYLPAGTKKEEGFVDMMFGSGKGHGNVENLSTDKIMGLVTRPADQGGFGKGPDVTPERAAKFVDTVADNLVSAGLGGQQVHTGGMSVNTTMESMRHGALGGGTPLDGYPTQSAPSSSLDAPIRADRGPSGVTSSVVSPSGESLPGGTPPRLAPRMNDREVPVEPEKLSDPSNPVLSDTRGPLLSGIPSRDAAANAPASEIPARKFAGGVDRIATAAALESTRPSPAPAEIPEAAARSNGAEARDKLDSLNNPNANEFREKLMGLESKRMQGEAVEPQIRSLFESGYSSPQQGQIMYSAYANARDNLQSDMSRVVARDVLTGMERSGDIPSGPVGSSFDVHSVSSIGQGFNIVADAGGRGNAANDRDATSIYAGRVAATQDATAREISARARQ